MFARIARKVLDVFAAIEDTRPSNRVRLGCERLEDLATPANFLVTSAGDFDDSNPGDGKAGRPGDMAPDGWETSLRSCIQEGNALAAAGKADHSIGFDTKVMGTGVVSITRGAYPTLQANYAIDGGTVVTVERAAGAAKHRIFDVGSGRDVSLSSIDICGGDADGGAGGGVQSAGDLSIEYCNIYGNEGALLGGGVAAVDGKLTIRYSIFT